MESRSLMMLVVTLAVVALTVGCHPAEARLLGQVAVRPKDKFSTTAVPNSSGSMGFRKLLLSSRANSKVDEDLLQAAWDGDYDKAKKLLVKGANPNARDTGTVDLPGERPLHHACERGHFVIVKLLLDSGAFVDARDDVGYTSLMEAARWGYIDILKLLLKEGAQLNAKNHIGDTALIWAAYNSEEETAEFLINEGIVLDAQQVEGKTALWFAAARGNVEIVNDLIKAGADINLPTHRGQTPLAVAESNWNVAVVRALKKAGATE